MSKLNFNPFTEYSVEPEILRAYHTLKNGTGKSSNMRGWLDWPQHFLNSEEYTDIKETATYIRKTFKHVVIIGIGGSYLGAKAIIEANFVNYNLFKTADSPYIHFITSLSSKEWTSVMKLIGSDSYCIVYISKSGGTLEPAVANRSFYAHSSAAPTVYAVTDANKGKLRSLADEHGWKTFVIPDSIGGRFSVFTPVGILPMAIAGIDTDEILKSAAEASKHCSDSIVNTAILLANWRYIQLTKKNLSVDLIAANVPELTFFIEWVKQLHGESEGKNFTGLFPAGAIFSEALHSLGQYLQQGKRDLICQTFITWKSDTVYTIPNSPLTDGLDKLSGITLSEINAASMEGSYTAHSNPSLNGNSCCKITISEGIGSLAYAMQIYMTACAICAYAMGVDPFDQPGVESYKTVVKEILFNGK